jgi:hypothetical protein
MQAKSTPLAPTLENLHTDILVLILLQFKIDDPLYFMRLVEVCRKLRANLSGDNTKKYWQFRLKSDFPAAYLEGSTANKFILNNGKKGRKITVLHPFLDNFLNQYDKVT